MNNKGKVLTKEEDRVIQENGNTLGNTLFKLIEETIEQSLEGVDYPLGVQGVAYAVLSSLLVHSQLEILKILKPHISKEEAKNGVIDYIFSNILMREMGGVVN